MEVGGGPRVQGLKLGKDPRLTLLGLRLLRLRIMNPHEKKRKGYYTWGNGEAIVQVPWLPAGRTGTGTQGSLL